MSTCNRHTIPVEKRWMQRLIVNAQRLMAIEAFSGAVLIAAALIALLLANSAIADNYHAFWATTINFSIGAVHHSTNLHFLVNEVLMTFFFLVVGMEVRREIHEGALSNLRLATLPIAAAAGGVMVPALIYLALNTSGDAANGWAVPTATDIAFAVGILALLGKSVPNSVRVLLLAIAIIDDVVAVLIIAFFYSGGLSAAGLPLIIAALLLIILMKRIGMGSGWFYLIPGAMLWAGMLKVGAHPTLAGVILGLMTPVVSGSVRCDSVSLIRQEAADLARLSGGATPFDENAALASLHKMRTAQRDVLPPVLRIQMHLHPWVAFLIMPIFALANAGVTIGGVDLSAVGANAVMLGVVFALVIGKPIGIVGMAFLAVRMRLCQLPEGATWSGVLLISLFAGIGFTMSIFIGTLAYSNENLLDASKLGVLLASLLATVLGLTYGVLTRKRK